MVSNKVGEYYDRMHEEYKKYYGLVFQAHRTRRIEKLLQYLNKQINFSKGDVVLDAGCGVCGPAIFFAKKNKIEIHAITNSKKQYEESIENIKNEKLENRIKVYYGDFHDLKQSFSSNTFDKILFLESFGHSTDKNKLLNEVYSILKIDGLLYIKDYFASELIGNKETIEYMRNAIQQMNESYCYNLSNLIETLDIVRKIGFKIVRINAPEFLFDNSEVVDLFEKNNNIKIFSNNAMPIIVEPLEMIFRKIDLQSNYLLKIPIIKDKNE